MNINDIVQIQGSFKQRSQGKNVGKSAGKNIGKEITDKLEFNVINELMGKFKHKKGKNGKNQMEKPSLTATQQTNPAYNLSLSKPITPDWTTIPSKSDPAMSEAEFEEAIRTLSLEYAERATEIGNSGKSKSMINKELYDLNREFDKKEWKLQTLYISVASPDRKAAYSNTKYDGSSYHVVSGNEQNFLGRNELMTWSSNSPNGWTIYPTSAEHERMSKYAQIRLETLNAYEAEHGEIPHTTISKSFMI